MIKDKNYEKNGYKVGSRVILDGHIIDEIEGFIEESDNEPGYDVQLKNEGTFSFDCIELFNPHDPTHTALEAR